MATDNAVRAVVAFPLLDEDHRQWIESLRARHDPQAKRIAAHVTLVLPAVLPLRETEAQVARVAQATQPIRFVLRRAAVAPDALGSGGHVFLLFDDGRDALVGLHERLYEGALQPQVKKRSSFNPHITVAAGTALDSLETLASELNAKALAVRGSLAELVLVEVTSSTINQMGRFRLGGGEA